MDKVKNVSYDYEYLFDTHIKKIQNASDQEKIEWISQKYCSSHEFEELFHSDIDKIFSERTCYEIKNAIVEINLLHENYKKEAFEHLIKKLPIVAVEKTATLHTTKTQ